MLTRRALFTAAGSALLVMGALMPAIARAEAPESFRVGYQKSASILLATRQQRLLETRLAELGVDKVEWVEFQFGPPLLEALGAGAVDIGYVGDTPPIFAQSAGANLVYVASAPQGVSGILVPEASPLKSVADLKGHKVALAKGSSAHNFTVRAVKGAGLAFTDIEPVYLSPADAVAAFSTGRVDAWTVWDPYLAIAEAKHGARLLTDSVTDPTLSSNAFYLANRDFAEAHPEILEAALREIAVATNWVAEHRDELAALASAETGVDAAAQRVAVERAAIGLSPITEETLAAQQSIADAFFELKLIPKQIDVHEYVLPRTPNI